MIEFDYNELKNQLKNDLKAIIKSELEAEQDIEFNDREETKLRQFNKQVNYNALTQKQYQGQNADHDSDSDSDSHAWNVSASAAENVSKNKAIQDNDTTVKVDPNKKYC